MEVNGDMMSKNSEVACLGSTLKKKRHDLAEKEPWIQGNERDIWGRWISLARVGNLPIE